MLTALFLFVLGVIIGSFLNVLGLRWNSGMTLGGRSFCVVCRKGLSWWELIPIVSFLSIGGRCIGCKTSISWQYPVVELLTGLVFFSLYFLWPFVGVSLAALLYLFAVSIMSIYMVIVIYDFRHKIIPDGLVYASILIALLMRFLEGGTLLDWLAGPIFFSFFGLIWLISRGRAMGFGDAKLALSIGLFLGASTGLSAMVLAFWIGTAVTISIMIFSHLRIALFRRAKGLTMKSEVPFAPFLVLGAWASLVYHLDLFHVLFFLQN